MTTTAASLPPLTVEVAGQRWQVGAQGHDLSIALAFDEPQPTFFGAAPASARPLTAGSFVGDVRRGSSCNCATHTLTPHCNGTHTECIGHVTEERISVRDAASEHLSAALLVSITPVAADQTREVSDPPPQAGDQLITRASLQAAIGSRDLSHYRALVVRTLPNDPSKRHRNYDQAGTLPYFSADAMRWIVQHDVRTLVVDLPSIDRANDQGRLTTHRIFWGLAPGATSSVGATRPHATVTELAYIDASIPDGPYLLNLQVAPFVADAAPSRPVLLPLSRA